MRKTLVGIVALLLLLTACGTESRQYEMKDGLYALPGEDGRIEAPYLQFNEGRFRVVMQPALSYQPSGEIRRSGNQITLKTTYAGEDYTWTFTLTGDDVLRCSAADPSFPTAKRRGRTARSSR